jgi:predicted Fe-Mo cluster-binding NifX family protein
MKIAIESNDGVTIKSPFLPTQGYIVYDIDQSDIVNSEYRKTNLKIRQKNGERKITSIKSDTVLNDCAAIISRGMDRSNLDIFKKEGMDVYITFKTSTKDAVRLYMRELLISNKFVH